MRNKFGAKKQMMCGIQFDSKAESEFYLYLISLQQDGIIKEIILQPGFELQPAFEKNGKKHRAIEYIADFQVTYRDGSVEIIDCKGFQTKEFRIKQKLFEYRYPDLHLKLMKREGGQWKEVSKKVKPKRKGATA